MKTHRYYRDRAAYLRGLAKDTPVEKLRASCLKSAEQFDVLAKMAAEEEARAKGAKTKGKIEGLAAPFR